VLYIDQSTLRACLSIPGHRDVSLIDSESNRYAISPYRALELMLTCAYAYRRKGLRITKIYRIAPVHQPWQPGWRQTKAAVLQPGEGYGA
jgi:hypothetical protein